MMAILCDIGGTYARVAKADGGALRDVQKFAAADFASLEAALAKYSAGKAPLRIATAAYPDTDGRWRFVNQNKWVIDPTALKKAGWPVEIILNDFEAATWALTDLPPAAQKTIKAAPPRPGFAKILLGPGTGLGLGYLHQTPAGFFVQRTHGGHIPAAAITDEQADVIAHLGKNSLIVFENLVSGPGLLNLYKAQCALTGKSCAADRAQHVLDDAQSTEGKNAIRLFTEFLGIIAATATVCGHAYGGLYLTGGMLQRLSEKNLFDAKHFLKFFVLNAVESVRHDLDQTPVCHVTEENPALLGLLKVQR